MRTGLICTTLFLILFTVVSLAANTSYTIKQGDTLYDIARRHNTSVSKIKQLNNFESNNLKIGSSILIPSNIVTYKIKSGDTLGSVAQKYGLNSSKDIIEFNGLNSSFVKVGQTIRIPSKSGSKTVLKPATLPKPANSIVVKKEKKILNSSYTVKSGDSLYSIAIKHGTTVDSIKELNNLSGNNLQIGQELTVTKPAPAQKVVAKQSVIEKEVVKEIVVEETGPTNIYKVKSGDTISQIAERHGVLTKDLKLHNNLESNNLKIGQLLTIPSATHSIVIVEKPKSFDPEIKPVEVKPVVAKSTGIKLPSATKTEQPKEQLSFPVSNEPVKEIEVGPKPQNRYHVVEAGDTLGHIAVKYNLESSKSIIEANNLGKTNLKIGQKLLIPSGNIPVVAKSEPVTPAVSKQKNKKIPKPAVEKKIHKDTYTGSYRVRSGDTVSQIAEKFNIKTADLKKANNLKNNNINVGQKLAVPRTTSNLVTKSSKKDLVYTVRKGDTLNAIANKFNVKVTTLKKYNNLRSSRLDIGDKLRVPDSSLIVTKSGDIQYKVVKGDSLLKIANNFNVSVRSLKSANGLNSNNIHVGDKLIIPPTSTIRSSKSNTKVAKSSKKSKNATIINYRVRGGDTLSSIARKHNSTVTKIKQANNLMGNSIYSGQKLKVPSKLYASTSKKSKKKKKTFTNEAQLKDELISVAKRYLGAPYKFGGTSTKTGIDCSAYVNKVFKSFDVNLPRTARGIYKKGDHVSKSKLQKGDLVFFRTYAKFPSHVGIYMGDGTFIHASSAKKKVIITNFQGKYYQKRYIGAKRIKIKDSYAKN